jgi:hypothetical protein
VRGLVMDGVFSWLEDGWFGEAVRGTAYMYPDA